MPIPPHPFEQAKDRPHLARRPARVVQKSYEFISRPPLKPLGHIIRNRKRRPLHLIGNVPLPPKRPIASELKHALRQCNGRLPDGDVLKPLVSHARSNLKCANLKSPVSNSQSSNYR